MSQGEYTAPVSLADAENRRGVLALEVQTIQAHLGERSRTDHNGRRLTNEEYWEWKRVERLSLTQKLAELRFVNGWIRCNRPYRVDDALTHLKNLIIILRRHELTDDERQLASEAEEFSLSRDAAASRP